MRILIGLGVFIAGVVVRDLTRKPDPDAQPRVEIGGPGQPGPQAWDYLAHYTGPRSGA